MTRKTLAVGLSLPLAFGLGHALAVKQTQGEVKEIRQGMVETINQVLSPLENLEYEEMYQIIVVPSMYRAAGKYRCGWDGPLE